jgi:hypothetical protein
VHGTFRKSSRKSALLELTSAILDRHKNGGFFNSSAFFVSTTKFQTSEKMENINNKKMLVLTAVLENFSSEFLIMATEVIALCTAFISLWKGIGILKMCTRLYNHILLLTKSATQYLFAHEPLAGKSSSLLLCSKEST